MSSTMSPNAILTVSGTASALTLASLFSLWYFFPTAVPFQVFLADHPIPTARQVSGGGPPPQLPREPGQPHQRVRGSSPWRRTNHPWPARLGQAGFTDALAQ